MGIFLFNQKTWHSCFQKSKFSFFHSSLHLWNSCQCSITHHHFTGLLPASIVSCPGAPFWGDMLLLSFSKQPNIFHEIIRYLCLIFQMCYRFMRSAIYCILFIHILHSIPFFFFFLELWLYIKNVIKYCPCVCVCASCDSTMFSTADLCAWSCCGGLPISLACWSSEPGFRGNIPVSRLI